MQCSGYWKESELRRKEQSSRNPSQLDSNRIQPDRAHSKARTQVLSDVTMAGKLPMVPLATPPLMADPINRGSLSTMRLPQIGYGSDEISESEPNVAYSVLPPSIAALLWEQHIHPLANLICLLISSTIS